MSFFSSLNLFHPNPPPPIEVAELFHFATTLRSAVGVKDDSRCSTSLKYGDKIAQDYETTNLMDWHDSGGSRWGTIKEYKWDKMYGQLPWTEICAKFAKAKKNVCRAHLSLGWLTKDSCTALTRWSDKDPSSGMCPDSLSIEIDPICPTILSDEELVCAGLVSINFPGNGYFTWGQHGKIMLNSIEMPNRLLRHARWLEACFLSNEEILLRRFRSILAPAF